MKYCDNRLLSWQVLQCLGTNMDRLMYYVDKFLTQINDCDNCDILLCSNRLIKILIPPFLR